MSVTLNNLCRMSVRNIKGLGLVLERGEEEEVFYQEVMGQPDLVDCTFTGTGRRTYFFALGTPEARMQRFIDTYNEFGKKLRS